MQCIAHLKLIQCEFVGGFGQDGIIGRNALLPHTTKRRITTNLKIRNKQNFQKIICMEVQQQRS